MDYRATILQLTQLWLEGTRASRQAFDELLMASMPHRGDGPRSPRGRPMGGGSLENLVWGVFFSTLMDSDFQDTATVSQIAAYAGRQQPYEGRAYIMTDLRPDMSEAQRAVWEAADDYLRAAQDREYLLRANRDELEARWQGLVADWRALPLAPEWERRTICDEVLRQVFDLLICQMYLPGARDTILPRGSRTLMLGWDGTGVPPTINLMPLVPWGRRALGGLMGTDLVQLSYRYADGRITFSLI